MSKQELEPAAAGKSVSNDDGRKQDALDQRAGDDPSLMKAEPLKVQPAALESNPDLAKMSFQEIEEAFGLRIGDRTRDAKPAGDMTAIEMSNRIEDGSAVEATEDVLAAAALQDQKPVEAPAAVVAPKAAAAPAEPVSKDQPASVLAEEAYVETRDGKGKIPYSVLETTRQRLAEAQNLLAGRAAKEQIDLERAEATKGALTPDRIEELRGQFPSAVVDALVALNDENVALKGKIFDSEKARPRAETLTDEQRAAQVAQDLIDQDPVLSKWQNDTDPANWNRAVRFDSMLREDPDWGKKPLQDRFAEVRRLMGHPAESAPTETEAQKATRIAAEAERRAAGNAGAPGFTHSDLPGGTPPAQTDRDSVGTMDIHTLASKVESMSPAQLERLLATV